MYRNLAIFLVTTLIIVLIFQCFISKRKMSMPVKGKISSDFGNRIHPVTGILSHHNGIDIAVPTGTAVKSPADGKIINLYSNSVGGKQLVVKHTNGFTTGFAHLSEYAVSQGDTVKKNQIIAKTGATGAVTGPHLHLTVKNADGNYLDPKKHLS